MPTDDELKSTFERARIVFPDWPGTFDQAMQSIVIAAMVQTLTKHPRALDSLIENRRALGDVRRRPAFESEPPRQRILFDYKKKAAGDDS